MWLFALFRFLYILTALSRNRAANVQDPRYAAVCTLSASTSDAALDYGCFVALFSYASFEFNGNVNPLNHDLCTVPTADEMVYIVDKSVAAFTKRGKCSFTEKSKNAQAAGFGLLIIANNELEGFPMGPPQVDFPLRIPVLMSGSDLWETAIRAHLPSAESEVGLTGEAVQQQPQLRLRVSFGAADSVHSNTKSENAHNSAEHAHTLPPASANNDNAVFVTRALFAAAGVLSLLIVAIAVYFTAQAEFIRYYTTEDATSGTSFASPARPVVAATAASKSSVLVGSLLRLMAYALIVVVFVALRMGTMRIYSVHSDTGSNDIVYNHRETDERVFETLVHNVMQDPSDYKLHAHTIKELRLAEENYSDELFIHPPLFVYLSAFLHGYMHIPLPIIPIIMQVLTMCLLPVIVGKLMPSTPSVENRAIKAGTTSEVGMTAMVLFGCCPIIAFCSQKFWIDNALMMAVTLCVAAHVVLVSQNPKAPSSKRSAMHSAYMLSRQLLSGIVFGAVGLNCKITAVALLPFSIVWILLQHYLAFCQYSSRSAAYETENGTKRGTWSVLAWAVASCGAYVTGAALAYAPWAYLYWYYTGRYSPNAWPSATMLQRSAFVQAAVNKPWYSYCLTLLQTSPLHLVGMVAAAVLAVALLLRVLCGHCAAAVRPEVSIASITGLLSTEARCAGEPGAGRTTRSGAQRTYSEKVVVQAHGVPPPAPKSTPDRDAVSKHSAQYAYAVGAVPVPAEIVTLLALSLWPLSFLVGLTLLGSLGSGFQSRFLLPMLPGTCLLSAWVVQWAQQCAAKDTSNCIVRSTSGALTVMAQLYMIYSIVHVVYYGIMFASLYADLDVSVVNIVCNILSHSYHAPESRDSFQETLRFMKHFGLVK